MGTAFDYAFRFEIERVTRTPTKRRWVAETAVALYESIFGRDARERAARRALAAARGYVESYVKQRSVRDRHRSELAHHCSVLAGIDPFFRAGPAALPFRLKPSRQAVADVAALLACAPVYTLLREGRATLNPVFGTASAAIGGADADAIFGDLLVEIKTTRDSIVERWMVRQLVGYALLAHAERKRDPGIPRVTRVGIYFARFAYLLVLPPITATEQELNDASAGLLASVAPGAEPIGTAPEIRREQLRVMFRRLAIAKAANR